MKDTKGKEARGKGRLNIAQHLYRQLLIQSYYDKYPRHLLILFSSTPFIFSFLFSARTFKTPSTKRARPVKMQQMRKRASKVLQCTGDSTT